jgi:hypothetical protein
MRHIGLILCIVILLGFTLGCPSIEPVNGPGSGNGNGTPPPEGPQPPDNNDDDDDDDDDQILALLEISPSSHNFGPLNLGAFPATQSFTVTNVGFEPIIIARAELAGQHAFDYSIFQNTCSNVQVIPNQACIVSVQFAPQMTGIRMAELRIIPLRLDVARPVATLTGQGF